MRLGRANTQGHHDAACAQGSRAVASPAFCRAKAGYGIQIQKKFISLHVPGSIRNVLTHIFLHSSQY